MNIFFSRKKNLYKLFLDGSEKFSKKIDGIIVNRREDLETY